VASLLVPPSKIVNDEFKPTEPCQTKSEDETPIPLPTISVSRFPEKLAAQDTIGSKAEDAIIVFSSAARSKALFCSNNPELLYEFTSASDRD
jgi:hypothetical protein